MDPQNVRFSKTHEWVRLEGDLATVGISDFAVKELTDLVYIELPSVGVTVAKGDQLGEVESVKAVSDLWSPVTGEIVAINETLPDELSKLSDDPFGEGWIAQIKVSNPEEVDELLDRDAYDEFCRNS